MDLKWINNNKLWYVLLHIYKAWHCLLVVYILANLLYFFWVILYIHFQILYPQVYQCLKSQLFLADFHVNRWCTYVFLPSNWNKYLNGLHILNFEMYFNNNRILQPKDLSPLRCKLEIDELPFHKEHLFRRKNWCLRVLSEGKQVRKKGI